RGEGSGRRERDGGGLGSGTFEAQWPGFEARCLRFVGWLTPARRKTRFQVLVRLSWAGLLTRRASKKGFRSASYITSPFPKLAWRDPLILSGGRGPSEENFPAAVGRLSILGVAGRLISVRRGLRLRGGSDKIQSPRTRPLPSS